MNQSRYQEQHTGHCGPDSLQDFKFIEANLDRAIAKALHDQAPLRFFCADGGEGLPPGGQRHRVGTVLSSRLYLLMYGALQRHGAQHIAHAGGSLDSID